MKPAIFSLLAAVSLCGCSSTPTKVNEGPIHASTFSFVDRGAKQAPSNTGGTQVVHGMVQEAITKNLANKGVSKKDSGGDITIGYLIIVGDNVSTMAIDDYFGYGSDASGLQDKAHTAYTDNKNPNYFEAGTLVIDVTDSKTYKLLKRGYATRPVLRDLNDDARAERIQGVVDEILNDVKISP